jgi:hypothetical protein
MIGGSIEHPYSAEILSLILSCVPIIGIFGLLLAERAQKIRLG